MESWIIQCLSQFWWVIAIVIALLGMSIFTVEQQSCAIIERFGKFHRIAGPGLNILIPLIDQIRLRLSLKICQLDVNIETKTQDNVFINLMVSVQYRILPTKIYEAFYMLQNPTKQIEAFVFDVVRAQVPKILLDDVFEKKDDIANAVKAELSDVMAEFGYEIVKALVTDISPANNVKAAMNEINAAQRVRVAATEKGEAEKILKVKQAEAEAEASILHGKGLAGQRHAIVSGLKDSVEEFVRQVPGLSQKDVMEMVLLIQYIDTLKEIAGSSKSNVIFVPNSPGNVADLASQLRESIIVGQQMSKME
ncbi:MAG: SPFH domain-containing protein [Puniceicoccales bacterium]|jgi:regulator of protease activity HflC (stomatin/prohibitin superfamily)|nr:SPFH domain-containing protein [Puniceicoccales bacterium]